MKHPVITVKPRDSALHARGVMEQHRINQLPVVTDGRLVGIVTDRDLRDVFPPVSEAATRSRAHVDPATIPVEDVMAHEVLALGPATTAARARSAAERADAAAARVGVAARESVR